MHDLELPRPIQGFDDVTIPPGMVMRNYTKIGEVIGLGKLSLTAVERVSFDAQSVNYSIEFEVDKSMTHGGTSSASLDVPAAALLMQGLIMLGKTRPNMTNFKNLQFSYNASPDLEFGVFSQDNGNLGISVRANGNSCYFLQMGKMTEISALILKAIQYIKNNEKK